MSNTKESPGFTWGDSVQVKQGAPSEFCPGGLAAVVAITEIETVQKAHQFGAELGSKTYLIEFGDGRTAEVPEDWLEADLS